MRADLLVVGAGPAGSSAAIRLARRGWRVLLVDRAHFPRPKPCGEYLNPGAVRALEQLGIGPQLEACGVPIRGILLVGPDGASVWAPFPRGHGLLVPRDRLDHLLVQEAVRAGVHLLEGYRVDAVRPGKPPEVVARHAGRSVVLRARLVIGADGIRSVTARSIGAFRPPAHARYTVGAHFEGVACPEPRGDLHLGPGWYAGAALYGGGQGNVVVALPRAHLRRIRDPAAAFTHAVRSLPLLRRMVDGARPTTPFTCVGPLGDAPRRAVARGVLLVGDAAGTVDPMTGQGVMLALWSAHLAAAFAHRALERGDPDLLAGYERVRRAALVPLWRTNRLLGWGARRRWVVRWFLRRLAARPELASRLVGALSEVRMRRPCRFLFELLLTGG